MTLVISLKFGTWRRWSQIKRFTEKLDCIFQERSHSIPGSKPPLIRALGAYEEYLSQHKKGVFRRKRISLASMMSWSKVSFFFTSFFFLVAEEPKDSSELNISQSPLSDLKCLDVIVARNLS